MAYKSCLHGDSGLQPGRFAGLSRAAPLVQRRYVRLVSMRMLFEEPFFLLEK
jgi:hypothetical protein